MKIFFNSSNNVLLLFHLVIFRVEKTFNANLFKQNNDYKDGQSPQILILH